MSNAIQMLVATPNTLYAYDFAKAKLKTLLYGGGDYYGVSWNSDTVFVSHSNIDPASLKTEKDYRQSGVGFVDAHGAEGVKRYYTGLSQPHQIMVDSAGRLFLTSTGFNTIVAIDTASLQTGEIKLNNIECEVVGDQKIGNHFNSLYEHEASLFVVAHNNGRTSDVYELDAKSFELIQIHKTSAEWAHNVWICEHGMITCDSKNGSLYEVHSGETIWKADEEPIITRGLAANSDYIFVGRSEYGNRLSRRYSNGGLWIIDRKTLTTIEKITFPATGCVNEIRLLGVPDDCHSGPVMDCRSLAYIDNAPGLAAMRRQIRICCLKLKNKSSLKRFQ